MTLLALLVSLVDDKEEDEVDDERLRSCGCFCLWLLLLLVCRSMFVIIMMASQRKKLRLWALERKMVCTVSEIA